MSCLVYTWDITTEGMSTVKWKGVYSYTLCSVNTVWGKKVLDNEITAAFHPPFTAVQSVMQQSIYSSTRTKSSQLSFLLPFSLKQGFCQRGKPQSQAWHQNPTLGCRERASVTTTPLSFSFFPSSIDIRRVESLYVQLLDGGAKEKLPLLAEEGLKEAVATLI